MVKIIITTIRYPVVITLLRAEEAPTRETSSYVLQARRWSPLHHYYHRVVGNAWCLAIFSGFFFHLRLSVQGRDFSPSALFSPSILLISTCWHRRGTRIIVTRGNNNMYTRCGPRLHVRHNDDGPSLSQRYESMYIQRRVPVGFRSIVYRIGLCHRSHVCAD